MKTCCLLAILGMALIASPVWAVACAAGHPAMPFVENQGQWDSRTRFVADRGDVTIRIERDALVLDLSRGPDRQLADFRVRVAFEGMTPGATVAGDGLSRATANFFIGNDPSRWRRCVPSYYGIVYRDIHPGVDVRVGDDSGCLKYDVIVAPGADLALVTICCEGVAALRLAADGSLEMETAAGLLRQAVPATWQELPGGGRISVDCRYVLLGGTRYGFVVPGRDEQLPLVIDPGLELLEWSTFLGTSGADAAWAATVDGGGDVIVTGFTNSAAFPAAPGAYDPTFNGAWDAWVARFDPTLNGEDQLVWCTYLGGAGDDFGLDIALDPGDGSILLAGSTTSSDFPTPNGYDQTYNGGDLLADAFAVRLSHDGSDLVAGTYLGDSGADWAVNVDPGSASGVTLSGYTNSSGFPTTPGAWDPTYNGNYDVFVSRLDPSLSNLLFSTFLGGSSEEVTANDFPAYPDRALGGLAISPAGSVVVNGMTRSIDFPVTPGAYQTERRGTQDAFIAQLSPDGSALEFATYFGGSDGDGGADLAIQRSSEIAVSGWTYSGDLPTTAGAFDGSFNGAAGYNDGYIACLDPSANGPSQLRYSSFLGGTEDDQLMAIASDALGDLVISGSTGLGFPVTGDAYDASYNGGSDAFLVRLRTSGASDADLIYGSFLGGAARDVAWTLALSAVDSTQGPVALAGSTRSTDFPTTLDAFDVDHNGPGGADAWVALLVSIGPEDVEDPPQAGTLLRLGVPHPNPSQGPVTFTLELPLRVHVHVEVHDAGGRLVADLLDREVSSGRHELTWDAQVLRGRLGPGVYFIRLSAGGPERSQKVVLGP